MDRTAGWIFFGLNFLFLFTFLCQDLVLANNHICVLGMLVLDGECVRKLAYNRVSVEGFGALLLGQDLVPPKFLGE